VVDLLDELAVERLSAHLTERRRHEFEERRAEQDRRERERTQAGERMARFGDDVEAGLREHAPALSDAEREQIEKDISTLHGPNSTQARALRNAMTAPATQGDGDQVVASEPDEHQPVAQPQTARGRATRPGLSSCPT
jgi:sRNA-binding protein